MSRPWFAPKSFGYGFTPTTWEGWLATVLFMLVVVVTVSYLTPDPRFFHLLGLDRVPVLRELRPGTFEVIAALVVEIFAFLALGWWKCSGPGCGATARSPRLSGTPRSRRPRRAGSARGRA
jgi:hypothetical protein